MMHTDYPDHKKDVRSIQGWRYLLSSPLKKLFLLRAVLLPALLRQKNSTIRLKLPSLSFLDARQNVSLSRRNPFFNGLPRAIPFSTVFRPRPIKVYLKGSRS